MSICMTCICLILFFYTVIHSFISMCSDALEVKTNVPETRSLLGRDILLDCHFLILGAFILEDVAVKWEVSRGSVHRSVYMFDGITENHHRDRTSLDLLQVEQGNASLHLTDVTLEDEGTYTCTVLIAPDVDTTVTGCVYAESVTCSPKPPKNQILPSLPVVRTAARSAASGRREQSETRGRKPPVSIRDHSTDQQDLTRGKILPVM
uniref:Ig-like domain-containing protein n=1 Tax=Leptobrachium leishanense TaxID=445787 RepID=A0A8C5MMG6_9ANUR